MSLVIRVAPFLDEVSVARETWARPPSNPDEPVGAPRQQPIGRSDDVASDLVRLIT